MKIKALSEQPKEFEIPVFSVRAIGIYDERKHHYFIGVSGDLVSRIDDAIGIREKWVAMLLRNALSYTSVDYEFEVVEVGYSTIVKPFELGVVSK